MEKILILRGQNALGKQKFKFLLQCEYKYCLEAENFLRLHYWVNVLFYKYRSKC